MEFEKGKYYEVVSNIGTKAIFQYLWVNTFVITYCEDKHLIGLDSKLDKEDKVINTFDNIHEVSKRIKEIEEKQKFVGLIYECDLTNLDIGSYDHSIIEVVEANYITEQGFDGKVKILKNISVNEEDKHEYKEGNILDYSVMFEYSKELTKEQYEQRLKELEKDEQEKQIKELQEENKQLRNAISNNANREIEAAKFIKSWQANPDFQKCEELLDAIYVLENAINNKLQQKANKAIEALENPKGEATGDEMKGYNMCTPQLVQLDCRNESCAFHKDGSCTNNKPALTITGNKVTCWTERD